jgi:hypothetical protein
MFRTPATAPAGRVTAVVRAVGHYRVPTTGPTVVDVPLTAEGMGAVDVTAPVPAPIGALTPPAPAPTSAPARAPASRRPAPAPAARAPSLSVPSTTARPATVPPTTLRPPPPAVSPPAAPPNLVPVPDVRGLPVAEASGRLFRAGFDVEIGEAENAGPGPARQVVDQRPSAGTPLAPESKVTLLIRPSRALPAARPPEGANRGWLAFAALVLALTVGGLTVRYGRSRQRRGAA